jgi:hypothetical protein
MKQNRKKKKKNQKKKRKNLSHLGRPEAAAQQNPGNPSLLIFPYVSFFSDKRDPLVRPSFNPSRFFSLETVARDSAPSSPQRTLCALTYKAPTLLSPLSLFPHLNRHQAGEFTHRSSPLLRARALKFGETRPPRAPSTTLVCFPFSGAHAGALPLSKCRSKRHAQTHLQAHDRRSVSSRLSSPFQEENEVSDHAFDLS